MKNQTTPNTVDKLTSDLKALVGSLDDAALADIIAHEAVRSFSQINHIEQNPEVIRAQITASDLKKSYQELIRLLESATLKDQLQKTGQLQLSKKDYPDLPRTLNIVTLPNGQLSIFLETKSKLDSGEKSTSPKIKGAFKHGTPCLMLWPRKLGVANKMWFNLVVILKDAETLPKLQREAKLSNQNHPFIQSIALGPEYTHRDGNHSDQRISVYGEYTVFGDASDLPYYDKSLKDPIIYSFLLGMQHLHQQSIIHRDLKLENLLIFMTDDDTIYCKIHDFGGATVKPVPGIFGSPLGMSPVATALSATSIKPSIKELAAKIANLPQALNPDHVFDSDDPNEWNDYDDKLNEYIHSLPRASVSDNLKAYRAVVRKYYGFTISLSKKLYSLSPDNLPIDDYVSTDKDDIWSVGTLLYKTYLVDLASFLAKRPIDDENEAEHILVPYLKKIVDKNSVEYKKLHYDIFGSKLSGAQLPEKHLLYIIANCLQYKATDRFTIDDIIRYLPDKQLLQKYERMITQYQKDELYKPKQALNPALQRVLNAEVSPPSSSPRASSSSSPPSSPVNPSEQNSPGPPKTK